MKDLTVYDTPITRIIEDNSVAEMQALEDAKFIAAVDEQLELRPPFRRWHEETGFVHMTGLRVAAQERWTICGIWLDPNRAGTYPLPDEEGMVTCLLCLAE
jgi:hypothetical protein